ncbi:succinyl-diaminopimelate desuccinylase [Aeromicrobium terrae]|uniref:Succinyl-diaminopimelate desuccinylase n=1 Tax=Aeromicrobium terrae TaxID=2498846 RepID=A0A5C8NL48_9ACTN|nr:succinyl-diaminopimelate desuccinylase [Aeromicrobium terrae]TXL61968.1 succinyl-diaminopimelate desuccinylase [Aeromicrobium terrae]
MASLDLSRDVVTLTADLVDIASESQQEQEIADAVEAALTPLAHLEVVRDQHSIVARTSLGRDERVVIAGHLDTVPANANLPSRLDGDVLWGLGSCDMKGGVAVALRTAATVPEPTRDVTYVFYEAEEIAAEFNGLGRLARERPDLLAADFAILMEPSNAQVEAGCQGTMRVDVVTRGERAHSARSWNGVNAIHAASDVLARLTSYEPRQVTIDGMLYREGMNAVGISGGVAGNVIPDEARVSVNYRFAPDRSESEALAHVRDLFDGYELVVTDSAPGALPGLDRPAAAAFIEAIGVDVAPKFGWTDVAQFSQLGVPAVNYGPGDPLYAHKADEHVPVAHLTAVEEALTRWLTR